MIFINYYITDDLRSIFLSDWFCLSAIILVFISIVTLNICSSEIESNRTWWEEKQSSPYINLILPPYAISCKKRSLPKSIHRMIITSASKIYSNLSFKFKKSNSLEPNNFVVLTEKIPSHCQPLLCFINGKSGGQQGKILISILRELLNPFQVFDITACDPTQVLREFIGIKSLRILVAGGDGTVGWILQCVDRIDLDNKRCKPPVAILPLGTGNDLARALSWGGSTEIDQIERRLVQLMHANTVDFDRWDLTVEAISWKTSTDDMKLQKPESNKKVHHEVTSAERTHRKINSYFGIGVDAQIVYNFHQARERAPHRFFSRFVNNMWYGVMGGHAVLHRNFETFASDVKLYANGKRIELPADTEGLIFLNISSYAGGARLWHDETKELSADEYFTSFYDVDDEITAHRTDSTVSLNSDFSSSSASKSGCNEGATLAKNDVFELVPDNLCDRSRLNNDREHQSKNCDDHCMGSDWKNVSYNDGLMEVVAVVGPLHLASVKLGISEGIKLGQSDSYRVEIDGLLPMHMQIDGEPWMNSTPCVLDIKLFNKSAMLSAPRHSYVKSYRDIR